MKQTNERMRKHRARRAEQGLHEVRTIYAPLELHEQIKAMARFMIAANANNSDGTANNQKGLKLENVK